MFGITLFLIFLILAVMVFSADRMIGCLKLLASALHWREYVLGFLLAVFAVSAPELFVGFSSAVLGNPALSLGNIFGANIINATLIVGLAAIFGRNLRLPQSMSSKETILVGLAALLPLVLFFDGRLSRFDGAALLSVSMAYLFFILRSRPEHSQKTDSASGKQALKSFILFVFWTLILIFSSRTLVGQAVLFARETRVSLFVVGLLIVSFGTALPEAIFAMRSVVKKTDALVYGNLFGTLVVNSGLVLGSVALIAPIEVVNKKEVIFSGLILLVSILSLLSFMRSGKKITWQEGFILLAFFLIFMAGQYFIR